MAGLKNILTPIYKAAKIRYYDDTPEFFTTKGATLENTFSKLEWNDKGLSIDGEYLNS